MIKNGKGEVAVPTAHYRSPQDRLERCERDFDVDTTGHESSTQQENG